MSSNRLDVSATQTGTWTVQPGNTPNATAWLAQIAHISAVVHISSAGLAIANQALAVRCVDTGGTTFQACGGGSDPQSVVQSSSWTIQAAHLVVVSHIAQSVHVGGTVKGAQFHVTGLGIPGQTHGGVFTIQGVTGMIAVDVAQSGTWTAQPGNTPNTTAWLVNVQHVSSQLHINIAGIGGLPIPTSQGLPIQHIASVVHIAVSGLGTPTQAISVRCVNTGATAFADCGGAGGSGDAVNVFHQSTIAHVSSITHVMVASHQVLRVMGAHVTGSIHVAGLTNVGSGAPGTGTTQMVCHSTLAIHVAAAAPGFTQLIHLTSSNGGVDQSAWRIFMCGIVLISAHAQGISLVEGVGTTCATGQRPVMGSIRVDDSMVVAGSGGFSAVAPFPWISTQNPGNNLCIGQTSRSTGTISGTITYRAGP